MGVGTATREPLYKIVGPNGECLNGGSGDWSRPCAHDSAAAAARCFVETGRKHGDGLTAPGDWRTIDGPLEACRNGLHLATAAQVPQWYTPGAVVYRAETDGPLIDAGQKWVAGKVRLLPRKVAPRPDTEPLRLALLRAMDKRDRTVKRATKARAVKVPAAWRGYLGNLGPSVRLPAGHPGKPYQDAANAADAAYRKAVDAVDKPYRAAQAAYDAAASEIEMPE